MAILAVEKKTIAHVRQNHDGSFETHELVEHLQGVANKAAKFACDFGSDDWAYLAGLWHDIGKFSPEFQQRIRTLSGYDVEAHLETKANRVDHSTAGALHAVASLGKPGNVLAFLIAGHHAGLADWESEAAGKASLRYRLRPENKYLFSRIEGIAPSEILAQSAPSTRPPNCQALWLRMLFSCLVDADFLDTEEFMDRGKSENRGFSTSIDILHEKIMVHLDSLCSRADATKINILRKEILQRCIEMAICSPGLFSLTVPTGGGKTLASMAFALNHAKAHKKKRIIYVIPYTSIIEQVSEVFREIFGENVIEHHSNLDVSAEQESARSRLACENWDAPIIVTTAVQFFESLFAARTSRVRKIHNITDSIVVLDEAQLLPPEFLVPITQVISELQRHFGVTFLLCTATQPDLKGQRRPEYIFPGLSDVREIIEDPRTLYREFNRVELSLPSSFDEPVSWEQIAGELRQFDRVLCIVNSRKDCRILHKLMPLGTVHLSALMCGEHRSEVIRKIKKDLLAGRPVRVISTQLVEAGVDLDFPVVYRAMAGLDSIAQAAGRCNREGKLAVGQVVVFNPPSNIPRGHLRKAAQVCKDVLREHKGKDPLAPEVFQKFFSLLYWSHGKDLDKHDIQGLLKESSFRSAANAFRIIDDAISADIIVRYGRGSMLIDRLGKEGPSRMLMRQLQRFRVGIYRDSLGQLMSKRLVEEITPGIYAQTECNLYDPHVGLLDDAVYEPEELII